MQLLLQELVGNGDYQAATEVQAEMRALGPTPAEGAPGGEVGTTAFGFPIEELYRTLFQAEDSPERESELNAVYKSLEGHARHTQSTPFAGSAAA